MSDHAAGGEVLAHPALEAHPMETAKAVEALHDPKADFAARAAAADRLGREDGGESATTALLGALHDPYAQVRGAAAFALGRRGELRAVGPLVTLLHDPSDEVRCRAAVALGLIGSVSVLRTTVDHGTAEDRTIRWAAIQALGNLGPVAVECLQRALRQGPRSERARVVVALGETRSVEAVGPLAEVLEDEDQEIRARAREALEKIRESRVF